MKLSSLQVDPELAKNGQPFDFGGPDELGRVAWFQIGYIENRTKTMNKLMREAALKLPMGKSVHDDVADKINRESMVGTVLLGFGNLFNDDDTPMAVNRENMLAILETPACFQYIVGRANELVNFQRPKEVKAIADTKSGSGLEPEVGRTPGIPTGHEGTGDAGSSPGQPPESAS